MKHLDLFSGIGGFALGLRMAGGFKTVAFCEIEPYAQKVLAKNFPNTPIYKDIKELKGYELISRVGDIDVITAGFPCQDISCAGVQRGINAERSGLFFEAARIISEVRPQYAILENVANLLSGGRGTWFGAVLAELAKIGYDCEWHCIQAADVGAPHKRNRVWIIAYPSSGRRDRKPRGQSTLKPTNNNIRMEENGILAYAKSARLESLAMGQRQVEFGRSYTRRSECSREWWSIEPNVGRVANGVPSRVDRLKGLGNAVVPQIVEILGNYIWEKKNERKKTNTQ